MDKGQADIEDERGTNMFVSVVVVVVVDMFDIEVEDEENAEVTTLFIMVFPL